MTTVHREGAESAPSHAAGLELLGTFAGSGYRNPPALVRRADGQTIQLTPLLYDLLVAIDGRRTSRDLAALLTEQGAGAVEAEDVEYLIDEKLRPLGVLRRNDGAEPAGPIANPLLAVRARVVLSGTGVTQRLATLFSPLFAPLVVVTTVAAFAGITGWLLFDEGLAAPTHQLLYEPEFILLVLALTVASAAFHEIGHAAACHYGGAPPGKMGVGLYLVWPVFYTDVSCSYALGRPARLRVDLGGLYFNAVFAVGVFALWATTGWDALLVIVPVQLMQMLRQLLPIVRFDGYHILADVVGVPDLFSRIKPILRALLPWRGRHPEATGLKRWVRVVVTAWVLVVVPALALALLFMLVALPRIVATAWDSLQLQAAEVGDSWASAELAAVGVGIVSCAALIMPMLGIGYLLVRLGHRAMRRVAEATAGDPRRQVGAGLLGAACVALLLWSWASSGSPDPIRPDDRWTLIDGARDVVGLDDSDAVPASLERESAAPARPRTRSTPSSRSVVEAAPVRVRATFEEPPPPGERDNQAVATNYGDGSRISDVAVSMAEYSGEDVTPSNESYAQASCTQCQTRAVAFQLVLIHGDDADTVVPQNAAVARNEACIACATHAVAVQLVVTLDEAVTDAMRSDVRAVLGRLEGLAASVDDLPLTEITATIAAAERDIVAILASAVASTEADRDIQTDEPDRGTVESSTTTETTTGDTTSTTAGPSSTASTESTTTTTTDPSTTTSTPDTTTTAPPESSTTTTGPA